MSAPMKIGPDWLDAHLDERLARAKSSGFDGYCTDCENATFLHNGRCGCGSGRVITGRRAQPTPDHGAAG
jgi:cobyrinic acid a,c-diamide synthase